MLAHLLLAFCLALFLYPLPLRQNVRDLHLACYLLLRSSVLRQHDADLSVCLLGEHFRHLSWRLYIYPRFLCLLRMLLRSSPGINVCVHVFPVRLRSGLLRIRPLVMPRSRIRILPFYSLRLRFSLFKGLLFRQKSIVNLSRSAEEHLRLFYLFLSKVLVAHILRHPGGSLRRERPRLHAAIRSQYLLEPCRQFGLQIDGIVLSHIHGFHLDIQFVRLFRFQGSSFHISRLLSSVLFRSLLLRLPAVVPVLSILLPVILLIAILLFRLSRHSLLETPVVHLLLGWCQRLMEHLQLHGLYHILALAEPQNQLIAFLHTAGNQPHPVIEIGQLIGPFLPVIPLLQLLQHADALLQAHLLGLIELVLQNEAARIPGGHPHEFLVVIQGLHEVLCLDAELAERVADSPAAGPALIGQQQHVLRVLIAPIYLVYIAYGTEHHHALHPAPVDGVRDFGSLREISLSYQGLYLIRSYFIFIFIQGNTPLSLMAIYM